MSTILKVFAVLLLVGLATPAYAQGQQPAQTGDMMLSATLSGTQEVPNPGDPDGTGTAMITLRANNELCWDLNVSNITLPAAAAHIHAGEPGVAGPVVVPLSAPDASGMATGCANAEATIADQMRQNPGAFYVNVHTPDFQAGAVRGQLAMGAAPQQPAPQQPAPQQPAPQQPAPQPAQTGDMMLSATLSGTQEVPNPGDPDGTGTAMITLRANNELCWDLNVSNITLPTAAAHIHAGEPGVAGPVVVPLSAPDASGMATGCANAEATIADQMRQNPGAFYVNVHTPDFQAGAVRGQLAMGAAPQQPAPQQPAPQQPAPQQPAPAQLPNTGADSSMLPLLFGAAFALLSGLLLVRRSRVRN